MAKSPFLVFIFGIIGVMMNPVVLSATDRVMVNGIDTSSSVQTMIDSADTQAPEDADVAQVAQGSSVVAPPNSAPVVRAPEAGSTSAVATSMKNYNISIVTAEIVGDNLSNNAIYRTGKLVYGHNTANLLGNLDSLGVNEVFTVTENGAIRHYRVAAKVLYKKTNGYLNGSRATTYDVEVSANGHDIAIMTCAGAYENEEAMRRGDASHRLVVFADSI